MNKLKQQVAKIHLLVYFKTRLTFNSCIKLNQFNAFSFFYIFILLTNPKLQKLNNLLFFFAQLLLFKKKIFEFWI